MAPTTLGRVRRSFHHSLFQNLVHIPLLVLLFGFVNQVDAVTVYHVTGQSPLGSSPTGTGTISNPPPAPTALDNGLQAYSNVTLNAPAPPGDALPTAFALSVPSAVPGGVSLKLNGSFFGFSVEMSVVNQVLGKNSTLIQIPFLNLMANIQQRVGRVNIRVGGNTQDTATLVASTPDGRILEKDKDNASNPTDTPPLIFTPDLIYMMRNISNFVNVHWYLGVPFNDTNNLRLQIVEQGQAILGDFLIGIQAANEPDLYGSHGHRPQNYGPFDYFGEFGVLVNALKADPLVLQTNNLLIAPSVSTKWSPEDIWNTGFIGNYSSNLGFLAVERYPTDNCAVAFPDSGDQLVLPQDVLQSLYLSHSGIKTFLGPYLNTALNVAQQAQKPFVMFETNTASCGGFPGLSDAFAAAIWGVDYAMQMAAMNFSQALFHVGGQSVSYNPFTPPPTNESHFHQWTVGPIYYSSLVIAEALGASNTAQVLDLGANDNNDLSPAYGIWENGVLSRVLLVNFANDPSGASDVQVAVGVTGGTVPTQVDVKYLLADSVVQKGNITWAGQTFGGNFDSDGRPMGSENITTVNCAPPADGSSQTPVCNVRVPAPGVALVFIGSRAQAQETAGAPSATFSTSVVTRTRASTASIDPTVLATSNGHGGKLQALPLGATSPGSFKSGDVGTRTAVALATTLCGGIFGIWTVLSLLRW